MSQAHTHRSFVKTLPFVAISIIGGCATTNQGGSQSRPVPSPEAPARVGPHESQSEPAPTQRRTVYGFSVRTDASAASTPRASNPFDLQYRQHRPLKVLYGDASYYHDSLAGNPTASGEPYDPGLFTGAHRTLPLGTIVRIIRLDTGHFVTIRINDRGPFRRRRRIVDLSRAAAEQLGMVQRGVTRVRIEVLEFGRRIN